MNTITDVEFGHFQRFIFDAAGITLSSAKKALVTGRLAKRLQACNLRSYSEYFKLLSSGSAPAEVQNAVELLRQIAQRSAGGSLPFRVWSAASSSGEEAYSIAMVLADTLGDGPWDVMGSDISTRVLERARTGHYPMERTRHIPEAYLKRFCLRGMDEQQGTLLVSRALRSRVSFTQINLNTSLPRLASFDMVFLRNVMIYFNGETKRQVVARIVSTLKPGGHLCIGHSESLNDINPGLLQVAPSIYRKP